MPHDPKRIVYVGPLLSEGTCFQRMRALAELGCEICSVDTRPQIPFIKLLFSRFVKRVFGRCLDLVDANSQIQRLVCTGKFNLLWIDKGLIISPKTLLSAKANGVKIVGYSPDDMFQKHNQSPQFLSGIPVYDVYFTTKTYGVSELEGLGCKKVCFVGNAYDPNTHFPRPQNENFRRRYGGEIGFVGDFEAARAATINYLAKNGLKVRVWGPNWKKRGFQTDRNVLVEGAFLPGANYATAISNFDINLCFLRKSNRDLQTTRSVEIPACGGFMLAEWSTEHEQLFVEGKEAEFFRSKEELFEKVKYYLAHPEERREIAAAGRARCLSSGYSNHARLTEMLAIIRGL